MYEEHSDDIESDSDSDRLLVDDDYNHDDDDDDQDAYGEKNDNGEWLPVAKKDNSDNKPEEEEEEVLSKYINKINVDGHGYGYSCSLCNKRFKTLKSAETHLKNPIECEFCSRIFCNTIVLGRHIWRNHPMNEYGQSYKCSFCQRAFSNSKQCEKHENDHIITQNTNDFTYCEVCNETIGNRTLYKRHIRRHEKEIFKCTICYKGFTNAHLLDSHNARLCDTKLKHECKICLKKIGSALYYRYHMNKHTGEKPYECNQCKVSYTMPCTKHPRKKKRKGITIEM